MIHIKSAEGLTSTHVCASNGEWTFDHNGWTKEKELLEATSKAYKERYLNWDHERIIIDGSLTALENFCKANNHRLPWQYTYLPWERAYRAYKYIVQFSATSPD